jgi:inhibitor of nuclear factor kappa-B kinase subunit alpha
MFIFSMMNERDRRAAIIALHCKGNTPVEIIKKMCLSRNQRATVYNVVNSYCLTGSFERKKRVSRKSAKRIQVKKNIADKIRRKPVRSQRKLAKEHSVSRMTVNRILREDLQLTAYKSKRKRLYLAGGAAERLRRTKIMKTRLVKMNPRNVIFSDEKIFYIEEKFNSQNRRVYCKNMKNVNANDLYLNTSQKAAGVMVFAAISGAGLCDLKFVDKGVKVNQHIYCEDILRATVLPWAQQTFPNVPYMFQQDGAPSHTARSVQEFCKENFHDFLAKEEWPAASPDLNPCDFFLWGWLEQLVCCKTYSSVNSLKDALKKAWSKLDMKVVESACVGEFRRRVNLVISQKGGPIEHLL